MKEATPDEVKAERLVNATFAIAFLIGGFASICYGIWIFLTQAYYWLKLGKWMPYSILDWWLEYLSPNPMKTLVWLEDWLGYQKIVDSTPASVAFVLLGIVVALLSANANS